MKYFDEPVPIPGALINGENTKKKEAQYPTIHISNYTLLLEPRYRVAKGDRLIPFGMREFETIDEILSVDVAELTYIPINPRGVQISFSGQDGAINFRPIYDFRIERKFYGKVPLYSKKIDWITDIPDGKTHFSARYGYLPNFEIDDIPAANLNQGQLLMQKIPLRKITINGEEKSDSYESSVNPIRGMKYE
ncbi:MAG: hypothetical protein JSU85_05130 [Candidatus Zixiibacteriota bacterium]|nr:MAG: hypothetical protein JSU85_05130 [candidate division Zixibacteria bacterium]